MNSNNFMEEQVGKDLSGNEEQLEHPELSPDDSVESEFKTIHLGGLYKNWFLDYASYVILERAVPEVLDGLKPVQRRILHAMKILDDGRYNKVANIIGNTMQYHPHGDASIGDALVQLGQKNLLIDTQGNWGNILTGDGAAASRYIEARLSKFAKEVVFNKKTTHWKPSYDGRNQEPINLPVKFCLLLAQGVEGIAVGLASKILPHNFCEIINASIAYLKNEEFVLYPDFFTGGMVDVSKYNNGLRGGRVRIRAKIEKLDKKTLVIKEIPYSTTTGSVIDSILVANDKGKIKIKKIDDNTAEDVEIVIQLANQVSPDQTIDALYAFTQCEISLSPNACVIDDQTPVFLSVEDILRRSVDNTVHLLKRELEINMSELKEQWHFASLEKIFIEKKIYRKIEVAESWEDTLHIIDKGLDPYKKMFAREITQDDIIRLTEIRIKKISKYNTFKAENYISDLEQQMKVVQNHLDHLVEYAISYFEKLLKDYGADYPRNTEIRSFDNIQASMVAVASQKLYVNYAEGFAGTGLKKDEFVCECSDIDDIVVFRANGSYVITKVSNKFFIGEDVIYIDVFKRKDNRTVYNVIYRDGRGGHSYAKRFKLPSVKRDTEYDLTQGAEGSKVLYFSANSNGEAEVVKVSFRSRPHMRKASIEYNFFDLLIKGKGSKGNRLSKHPIRQIIKKEDGISTLGAIKIYYDDTVRRINTEERGRYLGAFKADDKIICIMNDGSAELYGYDLSTHFNEKMIEIRKYDPENAIAVAYFDGGQQKYYMKRFTLAENLSAGRNISMISEHKSSKMLCYTFAKHADILIKFDHKLNNKEYEDQLLDIEEFIGVKGVNARGKRLSNHQLSSLEFIEKTVEEEESVEMGKEDESLDSEIEMDETPLNEDVELEIVPAVDEEQLSLDIMD